MFMEVWSTAQGKYIPWDGGGSSGGGASGTVFLTGNPTVTLAGSVGTSLVAGTVSLAGTALVSGTVFVGGTAQVQMSSTALVAGTVSLAGTVPAHTVFVSGTAQVQMASTALVTGTVFVGGTISEHTVFVKGTAQVQMASTAFVAGTVSIAGTAQVAMASTANIIGAVSSYPMYMPAPAAGASATTALGTATTSIGVFNVANDQESIFEIENGATALASFSVLAKFHPDQANFETLLSAAADYASTDGMFLGVTRSDSSTATDLTTLPASVRAFFKLNTRGMFQVQITASTAAGTSNIKAIKGGN